MTRVPSGYLAVNFSAIDAPSTGTVPMNSAPAPMASAGGGNAGAEPWRFTLPMRLDLTVTSDKSARVKVGENREGNFELVAVVSSIRDTARGPEHLVAHVRDPDSPDGWLLFNDFLVQPAAQAAVTGLGDAWRAPSFAMYANTSRAPLANAVNLIKRRFPYRISTRILTQPASSLDKPASNRRSSARGTQKRNGAVPLTKDEAAQLGPGFQYAFDAEFVVLEEAKTEVFSDGTQEMHRPPIHQLARLSLVRATPGPMYGVPFVDDYVATTTPIADLATAYSGIHEGDLVPGVSRFKLSTLKEAYKKLRLLVDAGCVVIGHGLKHDFRVIDIVVPMPQRRDTMVLFQSRTHMRPIALKFLYWFLCHKTIQAGEHSSVEDAQATLSVYEKYKECVEADPEDGCENLLDSIYDMGAQVAWKVPE
ncbi:poly(A)-specific ribonuclease [Linderina pennispora]|nr:poly(A)-specific ribonuclease [Linderina pennispora]